MPVVSTISTAHAARLTWAVRATAALVGALGLVALIGWIFGVDALKGAVGTSITTKTNGAICLTALGAALWLATVGGEFATRVGGVVALIAGATLFQYLTGLDLRIDEALFREPETDIATSSPNRMGLPAALSLMLLGLGMIGLDWPIWRRTFPFRYLPLVPLIISVVGCTAYLLSAPQLYAGKATTGIAWKTAAGVFLASLTALATRPSNAVVRILRAADLGGVAARRMIGPALLLPLLLVLLYAITVEGEMLEPETARSLLGVGMMLALGSVVLLTGHRLSSAARLRKQAERELVESQRELADFFENARWPIYWLSEDGRILQANRAALEQLGYDEEEIIGTRLSALEAGSERAVESLLDTLRGRDVIRDVVVNVRAKDGAVRELLFECQARRRTGKPAEIRCFARDLSDQHRLAIVTQRLASIVESSNDAIITKNLAGVVTSWNPGAVNLFGYEADEMVGRPIAVVIPSDRQEEEFAILERIRRGVPVEIYETVRQSKDGRLIHVSLSISPLHDAQGRIVGASKIARDITERKRIEAERESLLVKERAARAEAERAARMRDEFLAVVSHELRTPLNSILGWLHLLKKSGLERPEIHEAVTAIERGARMQAQLVEDLLDMSRIMNGQFALDLSTVRLATVIENALAIVGPAAEARGVRLRSTVPEPSTVIGDARRLQQVLWNLLSNAVKFTSRGGTVDVFLTRSASSFELVVRDSGAGISPEFLPHVFERFRQADSSTRRTQGGLGLGLSIVKHLVELHDGSVHAASEGLGMGSTFTVRLPIAPVRESNGDGKPQNGDAWMPKSEVDLRDLRVLVVDDDTDSRELVSRVLRDRNASVTVAESAPDALSLLEKGAFDVLISDIGMPGMDGYQFIRRLRESSWSTSSVPAVALSAYARSEDRVKAMLCGFQTHSSKPIEPEELVATVAGLAGRTLADTPD
jgi:PAS domain S-box-containing protein